MGGRQATLYIQVQLYTAVLAILLVGRRRRSLHVRYCVQKGPNRATNQGHGRTKLNTVPTHPHIGFFSLKT